MTLAQHTYPGLSYDHQDFQPVALIEEVPLALMVDTQKIASKDLKDYVAYARQQEGKLNLNAQ